MYQWSSKLIVAVLAMGLPMLVGAADSFDNLKYAFSGGTPNLDVRLRYENVEQDNALEEATAYTVRTRLGYTTGKWNNFDLAAEYEGVAALDDEEYNSGPRTVGSSNGRTNFSVIADPDDDELNQVWLRYTGIPGTTLKYGRQRIILDNARFIGNVGWRQNEQTFDGVTLVNTSLPKTTITYGYLNNSNFIQFQDFHMGSHLLNIGFVAAPKFSLIGYGYLLDFENDTVAARRDTQTVGLRATGAIPFSALQFLYALEYADQSDYKDAPPTVDAGYQFIEAGIGGKWLTAKLGYEVLGSNDGLFGFQTPLATNHAFQGWADLFLVTPLTGVQDAYLSLSGPLAGFNWLAVYHQFTPDSSGDDYGDEIDLQLARPINDNFSVMLKYADYSADTFAVDTKKLWVQAEYKF
ncbi:MAG: alginate export family protein [Nevskiales bacterium]